MILSLLFAATLSLSSFDDYRYVILPEGEQKPKFVGIGCGKDLDYTFPRHEDNLFLLEAVLERVAYAGGYYKLLPDSYFMAAGVIPFSQEYAVMTDYIQSAFGHSNEAPGDNFFLKSVTNYPDGVIDTGLPSNWYDAIFGQKYSSDIAKFIFENKEVPISNTYRDKMAWRDGVHVLGRTLFFDAGFVTNLYADIEANTDLLRRWRLRSGPDGDVSNTVYLEPSYMHYTSYDFNKDIWEQRTETLIDRSVTNERPYEIRVGQYIINISVEKYALTAFKGGNVHSTLRHAYSTMYMVERDDPYFKMELDIPYDYDLGEIKKAYAVCLFDGTGPDGLEGFSKLILVPVSCTKTGDGTFKINQQIANIFGSCISTARSQAMNLLDQTTVARAVPEPEPILTPLYTDPGSSHTRRASKSGASRVSLYIDSIITISTPTSLHATVLQ